MADDAQPAPAPDGFANLYMPLMGGTWVVIALDEALVTSPNEHSVSVEGGRNYLLVMTDTYRSRDVPGGEECYVRVLEPVSGEEKWHLLARSASLGHIADEPLLRWDEDGHGFTIALTSRPPVHVRMAEWSEVTVEEGAAL